MIREYKSHYRADVLGLPARTYEVKVLPVVSGGEEQETKAASVSGLQLRVHDRSGFAFSNNWYDHSDSRHPRVRFHHVHVYNNYYDGVAKYGIGATQGSSIFSEGNYFRHTKNPMLISMQGTDTKQGTDESNSTFSKENGGIIKSFNNYIDEWSKNYYKSYSAANTVHFDAYEVKTADETIPDNVKTLRGGTSYSNFEINHNYTAESPQAAKDTVT